MRWLRCLFEQALVWAEHKHAPYYLAGVSFAESSFFPLPPDVMLLPMVIAKPTKAWFYAGLTTIASCLGGVLGYLLGYGLFIFIQPYLPESYQTVVSWFNDYGFWIIFIAGFSPIPYKVFTIAAGATHCPLFIFILASLISRGARFYLGAGLMIVAGDRMKILIRRYIECTGWGVAGIIILCLFLSSCVNAPSLAPVYQAIILESHAKFHTVRRGETLIAIAWRYEQDYRNLARYNQLSHPYHLKINQTLRLTPPAKIIVKKPEPQRSLPHSTWVRPTQGPVVKRFKPGESKGIDIQGRVGQVIIAARTGTVAYAGQGLHGYGKLIIIKHDNHYLSAYAHNQKILVKEGQKIHKGQKIALMGQDNHHKPCLHFQVRLHGKPIDPMSLQVSNSSV